MITAVQEKWSCTLHRPGPQGMRNTAQTRMMLTLISQLQIDTQSQVWNLTENSSCCCGQRLYHRKS